MVTGMDQELKAYLEGFKTQIGDLTTQLNDVKTQLDDLRTHIDVKFKEVDQRFQDLEQRFEARFKEIDRRFEQVDQRFVVSENRLVQLITDTSQSLQREITALSDHVNEIVRRLDRQASLIQTGARFSSRMVSWSERVDVALEDLKKRMLLLEAKSPPSK